ncbi:MAG: sulfotransferase [Oscillospiraceae bacterium]|nr:sulfotransferase [Oscillospiraceae bacterium]
MELINPGHFLMGVRADTWYKLLRENRFAVRPEKIPQALLISAVSTALSPVAALEKVVYDKRIMASKPEKDPVFVLGHWRSGTTYLQHMLSRDEQFGWFDPVNTVVLPYSLLLGKVLTGPVKKGIANGRPMDNVQYSMDLPMEETFALLTQTDHDIIHMIAFPGQFQRYISGAFVEDLPPAELAKWRKAYDYIIRKLTYIKDGKQLLLKSPDNTGHIPVLREMYPDARFINIHRDPYKTIRSTVHMFSTQLEISALTRPPADVEVLMEDTIISIFERMYRQLFQLEKTFPDNRYADVAFTDFTRDPIGTLREVYRKLELEGYEEARPRFQAYADSQKNYRKNRLEIGPRLIRKINARLGFYFDHYGYDRMEEEEE